MAKCVLIHRSDSIYDDDPAVQYQFPKQYLGRAKTAVGDWILYLEPSKVRRPRGYFGTARIEKIVTDPSSSGMYLALIEPGSYFEFPDPVGFSDHNGPIERGLINDTGKLSGQAQSAVRPISIEDFNRILERGLDSDNEFLPRTENTAEIGEFEESQAPFVFEESRGRIEYLSSRKFRDRAFRRVVLRAYDQRCAFTGLKFINGGGRAEVNAAHIRPVEFNGPDSVRNGIALSSTAHWTFDRGLISLGDDLKILISRQANDPMESEIS